MASRHVGPGYRSNRRRRPSGSSRPTRNNTRSSVRNLTAILRPAAPAPPLRAQADGSPRTSRSNLATAPPSNGFSR